MSTVPTLKLALVVFVMVSTLLTTAQVGKEGKDTTTSKVIRKGATAPGYIQWDPPCTGHCAAGRYPRLYQFVASDTIYKSIGDVLQGLGFAIDPKDLRPKDPEFSVESQKKESCVYWTDLITLSEDTLKKFSTTRAKLGLSNDNNILYAIQVAFTCAAHNPLYEAVVQDPAGTSQKLRDESWKGKMPRSAPTEVDFEFSLLLKKRGLKSTYVDDLSEYDNRPILDWIYQKIVERLGQLKPDVTIDTEGGFQA
jgi:hypothetical protein